MATKRRQRHERHPSKEDIDDEQAGIVGELRFAERLGLDPTPIATFDGAGGFDFALPSGWSVDVKCSWLTAIEQMSPTSRKRYPNGRLMVLAGHVEAAIYVYGICHYIEANDSCDVQFVGWAWDWQVKAFKTQAIDRQRNQERMRSHRGVPPNAMEDLWRMATAVPPPLEPPEAVTTLDMEGRAITTITAPDGRSFAVEVGMVRIALIYKAGKQWFDVYDPANTGYPTAGKARLAAFNRHNKTGRSSSKATESQSHRARRDDGEQR
jgi:hypothetical protein